MAPAASELTIGGGLPRWIRPRVPLQQPSGSVRPAPPAAETSFMRSGWQQKVHIPPNRFQQYRPRGGSGSGIALNRPLQLQMSSHGSRGTKMGTISQPKELTNKIRLQLLEVFPNNVSEVDRLLLRYPHDQNIEKLSALLLGEIEALD